METLSGDLFMLAWIGCGLALPFTPWALVPIAGLALAVLL